MLLFFLAFYFLPTTHHLLLPHTSYLHMLSLHCQSGPASYTIESDTYVVVNGSTTNKSHRLVWFRLFD